MRKPLDDIKVLDLTQIYLGPYCGMLLSYLGAEVVKIEPPGGENVRFRSDQGEPPEVQFMNPSKRGVSIDLKKEEGKQVLKDLASEADVLIENFATGVMDRLGVGYEELKQVNPSLVYGHASGYGDYGPYKEYPAVDITIQAMGGIMETTGFPDSPPVKAGPAISDFHAGSQLALGILGALLRREQTGEGDYIEVAMYDCLYPLLSSPVAAWVTESDVPPRTGNQHSGMSIAPYNAYEVEDGYVTILCVNNAQWSDLLTLMDRSELIGEERFSSVVKRAGHVEEVDAIIEEWLEGKSKDDVIEPLRDAGIPSAPVQTLEEIVTDSHLERRGMLNYLPNQGIGKDTIPVPGMPIKFAKSEPAEVTPAPKVGEHTRETLSRITGYSSKRIERLLNDEVVFADGA